MPLKPGTLLGPHEIISLIGQGGMGEVYKARDTRLNRIVAIKTLPAHLADRPELRERFKREASTLANLKHAHICTLYDIGSQEIEEAEEATEANEAEEAKGWKVERRTVGRRSVRIDYLVMEYLEGETLAERLKKGPLPLEQVLQYAIEISDALDKAHRANFTHRDIKPGNLMLIGSGSKTSSKLLDFGLAKLKQEVAKAITPASEVPTAPGVLTQHGTLLGTLQYMSPEQVEGKTDELDGRTDVFAFGAVVYEMATGKKAFDGKNQASVIAKILEIDPPPMSSLQPMTPLALDRVVKQCLAKDPDERWQTAADLWRELEWIKEGGAEGRSLTVAAQIARRKLRERITQVAAAVLLISMAVLGIVHFREKPPEARPARFIVLPPEKTTFGPAPQLPIVSPDGAKLAFQATAASGGGQIQLWVRPLDSLTAQPLPGTEGATQPFWSWDSRFIAFYAQGKLKKIDVTGGPPQTLCDATNGENGSWNQEGVILFTSSGGGPRFAGGPIGGERSAGGSAIYGVSAAGGTPTAVTTVNASQGETSHLWPHFLPDGKHFFYLALNQSVDKSAIRVGSLDSTDSKFLLNAQSFVQYAPPGPPSVGPRPKDGYLFFQRDGTLMAQPFDAQRLELAGDAFPIAEQVQVNTSNGRAAFAVSRNGVLAYRATGGFSTQLVWFDRSGKEIGRIGEPGGYVSPKLSPDAKSLAVYRTTSIGVPGDIWVMDLARNAQTRLTFDPADDYGPIWSPDGSRIAFGSTRNNSRGLYQKNASGVGEEELLVKAGGLPEDWSSDGRYLAYMNIEGGGRDVSVLPLTGERKPVPFLKSRFYERHSQFSPDGHWMAYISDESGTYQVYVQPFPAGSGKWQVSTAGGVQPRWRRDGKELFYIASDGKLMAVPVRAGATFEAGTPAPLFPTRIFGLGPQTSYSQQYDVTADGQRFLLNVDLSDVTAAPITVVLNWTAGIKKQ